MSVAIRGQCEQPGNWPHIQSPQIHLQVKQHTQNVFTQEFMKIGPILNIVNKAKFYLFVENNEAL